MDAQLALYKHPRFQPRTARERVLGNNDLLARLFLDLSPLTVITAAAAVSKRWRALALRYA